MQTAFRRLRRRVKESKSINTSLSALGKVVVALATSGDGGERSHVAFRDSRLTRILKDSLAGNSHTTLLACLNPTEANYDECFNTLQCVPARLLAWKRNHP